MREHAFIKARINPFPRKVLKKYSQGQNPMIYSQLYD